MTLDEGRKILDAARDGAPTSARLITLALIATGDIAAAAEPAQFVVPVGAWERHHARFGARPAWCDMLH